MTVIKTLAVAGLLLAMMFSPSYCFPPFEDGQNAQLATVPNSERDVDEEGILAIYSIIGTLMLSFALIIIVLV